MTKCSVSPKTKWKKKKKINEKAIFWQFHIQVFASLFYVKQAVRAVKLGHNFTPIPSWVLLSCQQSFRKDG